MISIVAAVSKNYALGKENKLLWHLPKDFAFFKKITMGNPIIMGRKTFESLPDILPGRPHIVITRDRNYKKDGVLVVDSLETAIEEGKGLEDNVCIIGGGQIFKEALEK